MKDIETRMIERKKPKNRKTYHFKQLSTHYLVLYPLMIICWYYDKLKEKILSLIKWSDKRADRIITECIIHNGELKDRNIYYYWRTWGVWWFDKYHCHWKDRAFCRKYNNSLTLYFINEFQLKGYTKEVEFDGEWYNFTFTKIINAYGR